MHNHQADCHEIEGASRSAEASITRVRRQRAHPPPPKQHRLGETDIVRHVVLPKHYFQCATVSQVAVSLAPRRPPTTISCDSSPPRWHDLLTKEPSAG